jgi:hypothetical protein
MRCVDSATGAAGRPTLTRPGAVARSTEGLSGMLRTGSILEHAVTWVSLLIISSSSPPVRLRRDVAIGLALCWSCSPSDGADGDGADAAGFA